MKIVFFLIILSFTSKIFIFSENLTHLFMNQEITRIDYYNNGLLSIQYYYINMDNIIIVYAKNIESMLPYVNRIYKFEETFTEVSWFYPNGFNSSNLKYFYSNGLLSSYEYEEFINYGDSPTVEYISGKIEYFYDSSGNIIKEIGKGYREYEKIYSYLDGELNLVETFYPNGYYTFEKIELINGNITHSPSYDFYNYSIMDKKNIENIVRGERTETVITYFLDEILFEEQKYIFLNDRIHSVINNRVGSALQEYFFYYEQDGEYLDITNVIIPAFHNEIFNDYSFNNINNFEEENIFFALLEKDNINLIISKYNEDDFLKNNYKIILLFLILFIIMVMFLLLFIKIKNNRNIL
ncbi:MAG: hypothetical protein FWD47_09615 [Treponema sp.]|nr:hypothetical protein [Treponema sp.]